MPSAPALRMLAAHPTDGPHDGPIHDIHRGTSGYIGLARKDAGRTWRDLGAVPVGQPFLPGVLAELARDGYFTLNASYGTRPKLTPRETWVPIPGYAGAEERKAVWVRQVKNPATGLPWQHHTNATLRWLNVAYADLDCYRLNIGIDEAVGAVVGMQERGELPPASMLVRSGRGLWVLWLLLDIRNPAEGETMVEGQVHRPDTSARASARALRLYARVQRAIADKLAHLGADLAALDGPRYAPVPGTLKSNGREQVQYWVQGTSRGIPRYTLPALAERLGLELVYKEHPIVARAISDRPKDAAKVAAGRKGHRVRWENTYRDLEMIRALRGGTFNAPMVSRNVAAFYYALVLKRIGLPESEVWQRVSQLGVRAGLQDDEIAGAVRQALKPKPGTPPRHLSPADDTIFTALRVTDVERSYLRPKPQPAPARPSDRPARQAALKSFIDAMFPPGPVPVSARDLTAMLEAAGVPCGNHTTVFKDLRALGYRLAGQPAGRPPKLPL